MKPSVSVIKPRTENPSWAVGESRSDQREEADLASDDGDGRESLPEGGEGGGGAVPAVVAEHGAGALDAVHELDHVLHGLHRRGSGVRKRGTMEGSRRARERRGGGRRALLAVREP